MLLLSQWLHPPPRLLSLLLSQLWQLPLFQPCLHRRRQSMLSIQRQSPTLLQNLSIQRLSPRLLQNLKWSRLRRCCWPRLAT